MSPMTNPDEGMCPMDEHNWLAEQVEADDGVQES